MVRDWGIVGEILVLVGGDNGNIGRVFVLIR